MPLTEAQLNQIAPAEQTSWSVKETVKKLSELQGSVINLSAVLKNHMPQHVHFGDEGEIDKRPLPLQLPIYSIINESASIDARQDKLDKVYSKYLLGEGIKGRVATRIQDEEPLQTFFEDIYPDRNVWQPEKIVELFSMIDFWVDFHFLNPAPHNFSASSQVKPGLFINTSRAEGSQYLYKIDLVTLSENQVRTRDELNEYLRMMVSRHSFHKDLGINNTIDALVFPKDKQKLATALHSARV